MKKNDSWKNLLQQAAAGVLVIASLALADTSGAATATGTATATVVESVSVSISAPHLSGTIFTLEGFTGSLSFSGPLLRFGSTPPPGAVGTAALSGTGAGAAPSGANSATVNVTCNPDGSLSVSGGSGLTFAVSRPGACVVYIQYN